LFYDCLSPFSYLAFKVLRRYKPVWGFDLQLRPTLLAGVMAGTKNLPPIARPWAASTVKIAAQDGPRNKAYFNVPNMQPFPANFFGPDGPADKRGLARDMRYMRLLTSVRLRHPHLLEPVTAGVFDLIWADPNARDAKGNVIITEEILSAICTDAGISSADAAACIDAIGSDETKSALKESVGEAIDRGMYGAPFIAITDHGVGSQPAEMITFGSDRFEQLAFTLGLPWYGPDPERPSATSSKL